MTKKQPAGDAAHGQPGPAQVTPAHDAGLPADLSRQTVHVHCAMVWPEGLHCNECRAAFRNWAINILRDAGWTDTQLTALSHETDSGSGKAHFIERPFE